MLFMLPTSTVLADAWVIHTKYIIAVLYCVIRASLNPRGDRRPFSAVNLSLFGCCSGHLVASASSLSSSKARSFLTTEGSPSSSPPLPRQPLHFFDSITATGWHRVST